MWTRALPTPLNKFWQPNHFVPCLRDSSIPVNQIPASSMDTAKVSKDNVAVSRTVSESIISTPGVKHKCCQFPSTLQTGSTQHSHSQQCIRDKFCMLVQADSPLVQELDQGFPRVDQPTSHTHSLLIQEESNLLADSPFIQELDQALSQADQHTSHTLIHEQSTTSVDSSLKIGPQTCSSLTQAQQFPPSTTCKILDVHLSFSRGSYSNTKLVQHGSSDRTLKSYFKNYSPLVQHKPISPPTVQEQAPSQIDLHLTQELDNPFSLVDQSISESTAHSPLVNEQSIMSADSSVIKEASELISQTHSSQIQEQSTLSTDSPLVKELDQPLSEGDQSNSPLDSPLIQDSSMLSSDYSLLNELDHPLYQDNLHDQYEDIMITSTQNALSDDDHMDMVAPPIDEQAHLLPLPDVSVEWYKR